MSYIFSSLLNTGWSFVTYSGFSTLWRCHFTIALTVYINQHWFASASIYLVQHGVELPPTITYTSEPSWLFGHWSKQVTLISHISMFFTRLMGKIVLVCCGLLQGDKLCARLECFQNLFSCACHWCCDFSYFILKPRELIIKSDSLGVFDAFLFLLHLEYQEPCCLWPLAIHSSPHN